MNPSLDKESSTTTAAPSSAKTQIGRRSATNPPSDSVGDVNPPTQTSLPDVQSDLREQGE